MGQSVAVIGAGLAGLRCAVLLKGHLILSGSMYRHLNPER
jgi:predicted NAD/FAD-binding protein